MLFGKPKKNFHRLRLLSKNNFNVGLTYMFVLVEEEWGITKGELVIIIIDCRPEICALGYYRPYNHIEI